MKLPLIFIINAAGLLFAVYMVANDSERNISTFKIQEISNAIRDRAHAFLRKQNGLNAYPIRVLAALIYTDYAYLRPTANLSIIPDQPALWASLPVLLRNPCIRILLFKKYGLQ